MSKIIWGRVLTRDIPMLSWRTKVGELEAENARLRAQLDNVRGMIAEVSSESAEARELAAAWEMDVHRLRERIEQHECNHPANDGIGNGGNDWTVPNNPRHAEARIKVQASQLKAQAAEIERLRAVLQTIAEDSKCGEAAMLELIESQARRALAGKATT